MKHMAVVLSSVLLAALVAVGVAALEPERADAATSVRSCIGGTVDLKAIEKRMLDLHNRARADRGLKRLCIHPRLQRAARAHSRDMIQRDYFSHNTKGRNESACERIRRFGYKYAACGENIAWGSGKKGNPGPTFRYWMNSKSHRSNILDKRFREAGVGTHRGNFQGYDNVAMWTVSLGRRR